MSPNDLTDSYLNASASRRGKRSVKIDAKKVIANEDSENELVSKSTSKLQLPNPEEQPSAYQIEANKKVLLKSTPGN